MAERLQKYLARSGVASRRKAEELIVQGRVQVNNQTVKLLGTKVDADVDLICVDGKAVFLPEGREYFLLYKPGGVVTTLKDPQGRPTVRDFLPAGSRRLFPVGRLDFDAEGAILLTDDGELAQKLLHPKFGVTRTYLAKVKGTPDEATLQKLRGGVRLEDGPAKPEIAEVFGPTDKNTWLKLVVREGRPHLVKRLCAAVGHPVVRLFRPHTAGVSVARMRPGDIRRLSPEEVKALKAAASGKPLPDPTLFLPPRRHGKALVSDTANE
jgi:23S rRNA pseudouridine2605 synthase